MGSRRRFTKELKQSVVQQLNSRSAAEICRENDIQPNLLHRWKKEYESNPHDAFKGRGKLWKEEAKIARYERLIGQLYVEIDLLKKSLEASNQSRAEELKRRQYTK
jgi:transposase-like protein